MRDWRSYDEIADRYDRVWSARFEAVARRIWDHVPTKAGDRVLDIGTGTGVVLKTLFELGSAPELIVGCDRSGQMLQRARGRVAKLFLLVADATALPFRRDSFDVVTASFVLSHVRDFQRTLAEILRVLKPDGTVAVSNWAPPSDPYSAAWGECLAEVIPKSEVERASLEVAPWEEHFSQCGVMEDALAEAGFSPLASTAVNIESNFTVGQFFEDRELSSTGRLGLHLLGRDGWERFRAVVCEAFHTRFGASLCYRRGALIAIAKKP